MAHHPLSMQLPLATGLKADKGIELLTWGTPNGFKASIFLEELKEAYGLDYTVQAITIPKGVQKQPWYLALNPNGKIPTIVDHDQAGLAVGEGAAILQYLARHYDPEHKFSFESPADVARAEQWVAFMQAELSPCGSNNVRFYRFLPVKVPFVMALFHREALRQFGVLDTALERRDYLVGEGRGKYSIADIANFTFVNNSYYTGIGALDRWPNLKAWQQRIWKRSAVKKGVDIPYPAITVNEALEGNAEWKEKEDSLKEVLEKALSENPEVKSGPPPSMTVGKS